MKVRELQEQISKLDPKLDVWLRGVALFCSMSWLLAQPIRNGFALTMELRI